MTKNVCHIVNWYPNKWNEKEALWVQRHIKALEDHTHNRIFHVEVRNGKWGYHKYKQDEKSQSFILTTNTKVWLIREILTTLLLLYVLLFKIKRKEYEVFNFHIAYPLLTYSKLVQFIVRKPIVVTEHWSAYHNNFGVKKELKRIQRIFRNKKLKFIFISKALKRDVENFAKTEVTGVIVSNVVGEQFEFNPNRTPQTIQLLMSSYWKHPKNPFCIIQALTEVIKQNKYVELTIAGYGPQHKEMEELVTNLGMNSSISFIGKIDSLEFNTHLNKSNYFLHCSEYETFSVVCAEALCSGVPIIASNVGGIPEFCNANNSALVQTNSIDEWKAEIEKAITKNDWNQLAISKEARLKFNSMEVGKKYYDELKRFNE